MNLIYEQENKIRYFTVKLAELESEVIVDINVHKQAAVNQQDKLSPVLAVK